MECDAWRYLYNFDVGLKHRIHGTKGERARFWRWFSQVGQEHRTVHMVVRLHGSLAHRLGG